MAIISKRHKTKYPGVFYRLVKRISRKGEEKVYYIVFHRGRRVIEEKMPGGREKTDRCTPAKAKTYRSLRIDGELFSPKEIRTARKTGKKLPGKKCTIGRLWEKYKARKSGNSSFKQNRNRYKLYLEDKFSEKEPDKLNQHEIDLLRNHLLRKKSPQTAKHVLAFLRRLIYFGCEKGLCSAPTFKTEMPKVKNKTTENLTPDQINKLLKAIQHDKHPQAGNMMLLALYSGMRQGEMFKLKWADIDFIQDFITLHGIKGRPDSKIPLNDSSRDVLSRIPPH